VTGRWEGEYPERKDPDEEEAHSLAQERRLGNTIQEVISEDHPDGIVVGWVIVTAVRKPDDPDLITHVYFAADGQPVYATVGLLTLAVDEIMHGD